jgi:hypothetical protein
MRSFQPAESVRERRHDVSDFYASSYRESPAPFAMFTRLVVPRLVSCWPRSLWSACPAKGPLPAGSKSPSGP